MSNRLPPTGQKIGQWRHEGLLWKEIEERTGYSRMQLSRILREHKKQGSGCPRCGRRVVRPGEHAAA